MIITPLSSACAAEIKELDLSQELAQNAIKQIEQAWHEHLVLVIRNQNLSPEMQMTFAGQFGSLGERGRPTNRRKEVDDYDGIIMLVTNKRNSEGNFIGTIPEGELWFHSDVSYQEIPHKATLLHAIELPTTGGNTMFANMYTAFKNIPEKLKTLLNGRRALHAYDFAMSERVNIKEGLDNIQHCWQPIFIQHPETGRTALYVSRLMTAAIEGLSQSENDEVLSELFEISEDPNIIYEHVWQQGDLLMTDNRCCIHARHDFPHDQVRLLRRCTVKGDQSLVAAA